MNRRNYLALLGLGLAEIAGCLGTVEPPRAESPLDCPSYHEDDVQRTICTHETTPDDEPVYLERSAERVELPKATLSFTIQNASAWDFTTNFWEWHVWKHVAGEWFHVAPQAWNVPAMWLSPGESHTWTVTVDNEKLDGDPLPTARGTKAIELAGLGGGQYAFSTNGWFEGDDHESKTAVSALFELSGSQVDLQPTNEVTNVERDGEVVTVRAEREDRERSRVAAFELERTDDPEGEVRERIVEQLVRDRRYRNTLPYFEPGIERVRLVEPDGTYPPFGVHEPMAIEFEGQVYQITAEVLEE